MTFETIDKKCCQIVIETGQEFIDVGLFINSYFVLALKFSNKNCKIMIFFSQFEINIDQNLHKFDAL